VARKSGSPASFTAPVAVTGTRRHPSHTEAGALVWQPAKLTAKASAIHVAYLVIDLCPFAQHVY
jgi:hypothetical protein